MRIIIVGAGKVGHYLSERLSREGHEVVLIDRDKIRLRRLEKELNILPVHGSGASARTLEEAGIDRTDLFIAVTDSDEVNLIACIISKQYNVRTRIARVRNEDFYAEGTPVGEKSLGIDLLISPDLAMAEEILTLSTRSDAFEVAEFAGGDVMLLGYYVNPDNPCAGIPLQRLRKLPGVLVAIVREGTTIIPRGGDQVEAGDRIYLVTRKKDVLTVEEMFGFSSRKPRNVFIIGGSIVGRLVARRMEQQGIKVRLVEKDAAISEQLSSELEKTLILNCDGLESHDLLEEGIDQADLVISVTSSDTVNILSSLLAKHHGARKCITHITRPDFVPMLGKLGIDIALSRRMVAANMILRFVRGGESIVSVATLLGSDAEVVELKVPAGDRFNKVALRDLSFPSGSIVGAIVRQDGHKKIIIPTGDTRLHADDNLVIFFARGAISAVEQFLHG
ncbi:MAG: Trk system potassium transporter TrkA [Thermodesulfobacteriota bacterium]